MSQYIYTDKDRDEKGRLVRTHDDWFVGEAKKISDADAQWMPFIFGNRDFLALTEQDLSWATDRRKNDPRPFASK